jgi:hypothetical protein
MRHEVPLPPEWRCLEGKVFYVQRESAKTLTCSCPFCGGDVHPDGEWPDRCVLWTDTHPSLHCRVCGKVAYPDQFGDRTVQPPTPAELAARRQERIAQEEARRRSAERALAHLRDEELWMRYYEELERSHEGRAYWERRGIPPFWVEWWKLGWNPHSAWGCPTATIPIFDVGWQPLNIKHRLIGVEKGKYRYELAGLEQPMFLCNPNDALAGHVYAVEGELKAAVTFAAIDSADVCMVGLPGTSPSPAIVAQLAGDDVERVTLVMDPGAELEAENLALRIGTKKVRVLIPPMKIDDAIIAMGATGPDVRRWLRQAREV